MSRVLNVLIACEESQAMANAFRALGHNAFSCDLQPCSGGHPEYHIILDAIVLLNGCYYFCTEDDVSHFVPKWDLLIAHPPCTYLAKSSATLMYPHGVLDENRFNKMLQAKEFFMKFYNSSIRFVAVENPVPLRIAQLPPRSCCINPFEFGEPFSKATCLWLKNLPVPFPELFVPKNRVRSFVYSTRGGKKRSKTFKGIAAALARQWSDYILNVYEYEQKNYLCI